MSLKQKSEVKQGKKKNKPRFPFTCYNCNKKGHMAKDCRAPKRNNVQFKQEKNNETAFNVGSEVISEDTWIMDSGASAHMSFKKDYFSVFEELENPSNVILGNNNSLAVKGKGVVEIKKLIEGKWYHSTINDVLFVPDLRKNLISEGVLTAKGMKIVKEVKEAKVYLKNKLVARAVREKNNLYQMQFMTVVLSANVTSQQAQNSLRNWHNRLGHVNVKTLKDMVSKGLVTGVDFKSSEDFQCEDCFIGKQFQFPFKKSSRSVKNNPGELIYSDVCGPMQTTSVSGARYFVSFKDSYSSYLVVYFIKHKTDVLECFTNFNNKVKTKFGHCVKILHVDNGTEYINWDFKKYLDKNGIELETTAPYTPQQNGRIERENRTIMESARSMISTAKAPQYLWAEAVNNAVYILNRTPSSQTLNSTPFELWTGDKPSLEHVKTFGCAAYVFISHQKRSKLDAKSKKLIFVGCEKKSTNYRLFDPDTKKVTISRNVKFVESDQDSSKIESPDID